MPSHEKRRLTAGEGWLATGAVTVGVALTPLTFYMLFLTVRDYLQPSVGHLAWVVPIVTEVGFLGLFLFDLWLEIRRRPLPWLRVVPWLLAAASLYLNVAAGHGNLPAMVGHTVVVLVFFGYLLAGKAVARRLSEDPAALEAEAERKAACRYACDLLRDRKGIWWRWKVPSLLRAQVLRGRLPADVTASLGEGPGKWEPAVRKFVVDGLTAGAWMQAEEAVTRRAIEATAKPSEPSSPAPAVKAAAARRKPVTAAAAREQRDASIAAMVTAGDRTQADIAALHDTSISTVERVAREVRKTAPVPISKARSARG